jgi:hypothetical protein
MRWHEEGRAPATKFPLDNPEEPSVRFVRYLNNMFFELENVTQPWRLQMTLRRFMRPLLGSIFALFVLGLSHVLMGQAVNGTLLGTVTDPTGAVVSNAKVTIVLTGQRVAYSTVTNGSGDFTEPIFLPERMPSLSSRRVSRKKPGKTSLSPQTPRCVSM